MVCRLVQLEIQMEEILEVIKKLEQFAKKMNGGNSMSDKLILLIGCKVVKVIVESIIDNI